MPSAAAPSAAAPSAAAPSAAAPSAAAPSAADPVGGSVAFSTYENQRWVPIIGWSSAALLPVDPPAWSDASGLRSLPREAYTLPPAYAWLGDWAPCRSEQSDAGGWLYAVDFHTAFGAPGRLTVVRKRRWERLAERRSSNSCCLPSLSTADSFDMVPRIAVQGDVKASEPAPSGERSGENPSAASEAAYPTTDSRDERTPQRVMVGCSSSVDDPFESLLMTFAAKGDAEA